MLSPSSSAQRALQSLGARLREIRIDAGLTGRELARLAGWHSSKISKIEHGRQSPSAEDIKAWCEFCRAGDQTSDLIASLRSVQDMYVEWRRVVGTGFEAFNRSVLPLWERTRRFRIYSSQLVPGPLQTRRYIRAVLTGLRDMYGLPDDVDDTVQVKLGRQQIIHRGQHQFAVLIEESALHYPVGGSETMAGQLGYLLEAASLPSVSLGVIPLGTDRSAILPVECFFLFDEDRVEVELVSGQLKITQPSEVALYARTFSMLADQAVYGAEARALITGAIEALDRPGR